jgi:hypothetical protein
LTGFLSRTIGNKLLDVHGLASSLSSFFGIFSISEVVAIFSSIRNKFLKSFLKKIYGVITIFNILFVI